MNREKTIAHNFFFPKLYEKRTTKKFIELKIANKSPRNLLNRVFTNVPNVSAPLDSASIAANIHSTSYLDRLFIDDENDNVAANDKNKATTMIDNNVTINSDKPCVGETLFGNNDNIVAIDRDIIAYAERSYIDNILFDNGNTNTNANVDTNTNDTINDITVDNNVSSNYFDRSYINQILFGDDDNLINMCTFNRRNQENRIIATKLY